MNEANRYRRAVRAVWERSYLEYQAWPAATRERVQPGLDVLLAWLADAASEDELVRRYIEVGDAPGRVLHPHLPGGFADDELLVLEEAAFWLRLLMLRSER